ncbi:imidazole glycerol phosphate synthase subunit HisH [Acetonema longum]|uniref:Imidazole glycerol phosphate synthase subunit HisH n=1 Tax=Acetonema longum DSM 6540 TaxID=1009370 RepID=F7NEP1_9FIRM|nr:imidazole glycerol phosphate synthase subunit HisH [Acetonema longum]EGO65452.1 imidazole glycerol phosphate synthase subunit HisH [Acetonema longum DSM 6540]
MNSKADIAIIDYGMGNLGSVAKAFTGLGVRAEVTGSPNAILQAGKVVLPGVGAFGDCMANLGRFGLIDTIRRVIDRGTPFLGICLGLQMLFEGSEEDPGIPGLGIFPGLVKNIEAPGLKVPHMGWNSLSLSSGSPLFVGLGESPCVYFVHSYHAVPADPSIITAAAVYGGTVTAAVGKDTIQAVQFHPEKSSATGLKILKNFIDNI